MILCDVNVLVHAHRAETTNHADYRIWMEDMINSGTAFAVSDIVLGGFIGVVTHPRVFREPSPLADALAFASQLIAPETCVRVTPGPRHWTLFDRLCREGGANGNLVADAFLAALAIENGCEWITTDRGFSRFPGLRWRHPLQ
ncbi:MAG: type II toxin-antitoxin system VapC family toxin [Alphaproteobacteria bacterium]|jgi:hypothetical protein|nr:type II toxin-antitoxin system VapC family toxin [Alphaproteobacteria bacterium]MDP6517082.1 type II toxin-antitoxin system VapC family toxin [Alphaproteobacteria bacterium]|tara:strand:+ start:811 stop:1239 length:429 start_codon:yes stop_codon:yes gene_type:complete